MGAAGEFALVQQLQQENKALREELARARKPLDGEFLSWVADRLVSVYGESPNVDFVLRLRRMAPPQEAKG